MYTNFTSENFKIRDDAKVLGVNGRGIILRYYPSIHLKTSVRIAGLRAEILNSGRPEYEAGMLTIPSRLWEIVLRLMIINRA
jgi:hypothetical protein